MKNKQQSPTLSTQPYQETVIIRNLSLVSVIGNALLSGFKLLLGCQEIRER